LTNQILQLAGILLAICGWVAVNFILVVYISVKKLGGNLEKKDILVLCGIAALLFLGAIILFMLGASV
jgi:hypothetical protein